MLDLLIKNANELLCIRGEGPKAGTQMRDLTVIGNGTLGIKGREIALIGEDVSEPEAREVIDASGKVVMPGFVDPHTHLVFAGTRENELKMKVEGRSYLEILEAGGGIHYTVMGTRTASREQLVEDGLKRLDRMLVQGTTTAEAKSGYGLTVEDELKCLEVINELNRRHAIDVVPTFLGAHVVPDEFKGRSDKYVELIIDEMLPLVVSNGLARFCDVFCEKGVFTVEQTRKLLMAAKEVGLVPKLHADELHDTGGAALAAELGCISADHLLKSSESGIRHMARSGVIGVLLPGTSFTTMENYANARKYSDYNLPIALATDFNPNCWLESMGFVAALACYQMRLTPAEALVAATYNAARALGRTDIGSLEAGKKADVLVLDVPNHQSVPYRLGHNLVKTVVKGGKVVVEEGRLVGNRRMRSRTHDH